MIRFTDNDLDFQRNVIENPCTFFKSETLLNFKKHRFFVPSKNYIYHNDEFILFVRYTLIPKGYKKYFKYWKVAYKTRNHYLIVTQSQYKYDTITNICNVINPIVYNHYYPDLYIKRI